MDVMAFVAWIKKINHVVEEIKGRELKRRQLHGLFLKAFADWSFKVHGVHEDIKSISKVAERMILWRDINYYFKSFPPSYTWHIDEEPMIARWTFGFGKGCMWMHEDVAALLWEGDDRVVAAGSWINVYMKELFRLRRWQREFICI